MPSHFKILLEKEIKEILRDPKLIIGMIVMPVVMFGVMGYAMRISFSAIKEAALKPKIAVLDYDGGSMSKTLIELLESTPGAKVELLSSPTISDAIGRAIELNLPVLVVIPRGFTENITLGVKARVELYTIFRALSMAEIGTSSAPASIVEFFNDYLVNKVIREAFPNRDPSVILNPIEAVKYSVVKGRIIEVSPESIIGVIQSQSITMPVTVMMVLVFAMQIAATSIAIEKEEKTLETLLSLPVNRLSILASKLVSSIIIAAIGSSVYMLGYTHYISTFTESSFTELAGQMEALGAEALGLTITPLGFMLLGISLFLAIISALAMSIAIAVFAEDVRSAQTIVGYLYLPIFIPSFILMFTDIKTLPFHIQLLLYAIPFTHPIIASKAALLEDYYVIAIGIIYTALLTIAILYVTAKLFTTEKILTAKISFKKLRFKGKLR